MYYRIVCLFFVFLFSINSFGQIDEDHKSLAEYIQIAEEAEQQMDTHSAVKAYQNALVECRKTNSADTLVIVLYSYGSVLTYSGDYEKAIEATVEAFENTDKVENSKELKAMCFMQLGIIYYFMQDYDNALDNYSKSMTLAEELGNQTGYSIALINVANIYQERADFETAINLYHRCLDIQNDVQDSATICNCLYNIGTCYDACNRHDEAFAFYKQSESVALDIHDYEIYTLSLLKIAEETADKGNLQGSFDMISRCVNVARKYGYLQVLLKVFDEGAELYAKAGLYKEAYEFAYNSKELSDSLFKEAAAAQLNEFQVRNDTREKEHKLSIQETQLKLGHRIQWSLGVTLLLFAVAVFLLVRLTLFHIRRNKELKEVDNIKNKFFSIISHDLKSPIIAQNKMLELLTSNFDAIPDDVKKQQCTTLLNSSKSTLELLNNLLDWSRIQTERMVCEPVCVPIIDVVREALSVFTMQAENKSVSFVVEVPDDAVAECDRNMIRIVFRNLLSNAVKFSYEGGTVKVVACQDEKMWRVSVIDCGTGMSCERLDSSFKLNANKSVAGTGNETGTGLGLIVCKELTELNNGKLLVESEEGKGTTVSFTLNMAI